MKTIAVGLFIGLAAASITSSCKKDYLVLPESTVPDTVKFSIDIIPIFNESCNTSGCHDGAFAPNLSPATAYDDLMMDGLVDTANAQESTLYKKITTGNMPPSGKLAQTKTDLVLVWIQQGALNN